MTKQKNELRVLFVIPGEAQGTSMIFAKRQAVYLQKKGVTIYNYYLSSRTSPLVLIKEAMRLRKEIKENSPQLVHAHFGTMTAFFCMMATTLPLVITYRGSDLNPSDDISWIRSLLGRLLSQLAALRASQIICVSSQLRSRLWWKKDKTTVLSSGVDTQMFYPRNREESRSKLGWDTEEKVVLFNIGRFPKVKRLDLAQAAINEVKKIYGDIRFEVMNGHLEPETVALMLNASNALVITSDYEGSPNILKEAMACNLPVVSVDVGDVRERLKGDNLSRVVIRDPYYIAMALVDVIKKGERSNGAEVIHELSLNIIAQKLMSIYQSALSGSKDDI